MTGNTIGIGNMSVAQEMQDLTFRLADLFGDAKDMSELDAAEFVDNAGEIWTLRERAREIVESMS